MHNLLCKVSKRYFAASVISLFFSALITQHAHASDFSWIDDEPTAKVVTHLSPLSGDDPNCIPKQVPIGNVLGEKFPVCVYKAKDFYYGLYQEWSGGYLETRTVIGFPGDGAMYKVSGLPGLPIYRPSSNIWLYRSSLPWSTWGYYGYFINDLPSQLTRHYTTTSPFSMEYELRSTATQNFLPDENGNPTMIRSVGISQNGKWLAVELRPGGLLRENLETGEKKWFSVANPVYGQGNDPIIEFGISNDGKRITVAGLNTEARVYEIADDCGKNVTIFYSEWRSFPPPVQACPSRAVADVISAAIGGDLRTVRAPKFNFDGGELTVYASPYLRPNVPFKEQWVTLHAADYTPSTSLEYLALGDSYSSGEGDTEKNPDTGKKYYREPTDQEADAGKGLLREKCHLSTRSYPYKIADVLSLSINNQWNSVACGGAYINDIGGRSDDYKGQGDRLADLGEKSRIEAYKTKALNEFIPGREQQIKFVEKYKPKVITLTAGGNNVDFDGVIKACIVPIYEATFTCSYAKDNSSKRRLSIDIKNRFEDLKKLYTKLHEASDEQAKIYVFGYPEFVNPDSAAKCSVNVQLNRQEREMATESIHYMNDVIEVAAKAAGVKYIDIQEGLKGHRLCDDGDKAVTGIAFWMDSENQESFHPNAYGHGLMANAVFEKLNHQSPQEYFWCSAPSARICPDSKVDEPAMPPYFKEAYDTDTKNSAYIELTSDTAKFKKTTVTIKVPESTLDPSSDVTVVMYSNPVNLGTLVTNNAGGLEGDLTIPEAIPVGFHTLVLSGKTFSGEGIDLWQIIEIQSSDPNDRDEDGIPDDKDRCMYIRAANIDKDGDAIDDACDPFVGDTKEVESQSAAALNEVKQKYAIANNQYLSVDSVNNNQQNVFKIHKEGSSSTSLIKTNSKQIQSSLPHSRNKANSIISYILGGSIILMAIILIAVLRRFQQKVNYS